VLFLRNGKYDKVLHHESYLAVGVPGTVAGLHRAWKERGSLPWKGLVAPAVALARDGFPVNDALARSLKGALPEMRTYPASMAAASGFEASLRSPLTRGVPASPVPRGRQRRS
jgi:gamma-glutamyltranspeptidase